MNSIRRSLILVLWLISMTAGAAPVGSASKVGGPGMAQALPQSGIAPAASSAEADAETLMRRLRAVIEELKRQGPPPIGCMEG